MSFSVEQRLLRRSTRTARRRALLIAGGYAVAALGWILGTDALLGFYGSSSVWHGLADAAKGTLFVGVTALLLYTLLRGYLSRTEHVAAHLDLLARRSPDMIFRYRLHPERGYEYVSPAAELLTGYTVAEHYANPDLPLEIVHPDHREELRRQLEHPEGLRSSDEVRWVHRDGSTVWVELRTSVVRDHAGQVVGVEGIVRDITGRRKRDRRRRILAAAVEAANDSVVITDPEGRIEYVNPAFTRITGWTREAALGRNPRILRSGVQDPAFYRRMWEALTSGHSFQGRFVNRRADGTLYTQEATIAPLIGPSGKVEHYVAVARDVTERELMERQLREAQMAEVVGHFVGGVSHDFRNLLGIVQAQVELAAGLEAEGRYPAAELAEIASATKRGTELVRKLLTLGRPGEVAAAPVSLAEIVAGLHASLRAILPDAIALELHIAPGDELMVHADRGAIEQILLNLVGNARDALPAGGTIVVEVARTDQLGAESNDAVLGVVEKPPEGWIRLCVRDDGQGIQPAAMERIFEPFYTTKPAGQGTGLGMPMVARLARLHAGAVTVRSRPGYGTSATLLLPALAGAEPERPQEDAAAGAAPRGRGQRILVVEDEEPLLQVQMKALRRLGYEPLAARDGSQALTILQARSTEIDLVMTDVMMPGRGGRELYDDMGAVGLRGIPVVFMSGHSVIDLPGRLPPGVERRFLEKPWTVKQLARKVADVLDTEARQPADAAT